MTKIKIYILLILFQGVFSAAPSTLRLISVVFRHGDRSPTASYSNDPYPESYWPQGYGQLTKEGVNRAYNLGVFLRDKYDGFLDKSYKREEIYVRSTDIDRTLMTAQAVLNGLYPPVPDQVWKQGLPWQPIPVHTVQEQDDVLYGNKRCTTAERTYEKVMSDPNTIQYFNTKYGHVLDVLDKESGNSTFNNKTGDLKLGDVLKNINHVTDATFCEKHNNLTVPVWIDGIWNELQEIQHLYHYLTAGNRKLARIHGGVMLGQFVRDMQLRVSAILPPDMKAFIYSGHDTTLWNLLTSLDLWHNDTVFYSTCIMVELHQIDGKYVVQMFKRDGKTEVLETMKLEKCEELCPLEKFVNLTADSIPEDRERECQVFGAFIDLDFSNPATIIFASLFGGIILLLFLTIVLAVCCGRGRNSGTLRGLRAARGLSASTRRHSGYGKLRGGAGVAEAGAGGISAEEMPMIVQHGGSDEE